MRPGEAASVPPVTRKRDRALPEDQLVRPIGPQGRVWIERWILCSRVLCVRGGARGGESKCNVLTRFDAFVLIVTNIGRPRIVTLMVMMD